ncbi:MAG: SDR family oxidoreductase [Chthoniobacteraceae bacterium]
MRILITGTSSGIGRGLAQRYCEAGHEVWGVARRDQAEFVLDRQRLGHSFRATRADVSRWDQLESWSREVQQAWGSADALICAAGIQGPLGPAMQLSAEAWSQNLNINLNGTFYTLLATHPLLLRATRRAKIICFSGGGSTGPRPFFTPYAVAKGGVVRMVENLAHEWAGMPVDINALAPGAVNTRMTEEVIAAGPACVGEREHRKTVEQAKNGGTPIEKVSAAIEFLLSPESDGISGRLISGLWDPLHLLPEKREELQCSDIYTLRRIVPEDRGLEWK